MGSAQPIDPLGADIKTGFTEQLIGKQSAAHADLAMNAPYRQFDALGIEGLLPSEHMLIDAVHQRAVEIKQEHGFKSHRALPLAPTIRRRRRLDDRFHETCIMEPIC